MIDVKIPELGESITEASIAKWYKKEGDFVNEDEIILEVETEKVTLEVTAPSSGELTQILAKEDQNVQVGDVVAKINEESKVNPSSSTDKSEKEEQKDVNLKNNNISISPSANKIANENNINISEIKGSGPKGNIIKMDVLDINNNIPNSQDTNLSPGSERTQKKVKMSKLRQTIALRLKESQNTAAILSTFNEIDMFNVMNMRSKYKEAFEKKYSTRLGFMSFFVKATVEALQEIPDINAELQDNEIIYKNYCDIGVAVGTEQGLVVPVLRNAEKLNFAEIESSIFNLGKRARENKLTMNDLTGGTFSITNGGVYGSLLSTPIINPPQSGILGMHNIVNRPVAIDNKVEIRPMMYIALSYDHRIVDGKAAVTFLVKIKNFIENPERLLIGV